MKSSYEQKGSTVLPTMGQWIDSDEPRVHWTVKPIHIWWTKCFALPMSARFFLLLPFYSLSPVSLALFSSEAVTLCLHFHTAWRQLHQHLEASMQLTLFILSLCAHADCPRQSNCHSDVHRSKWKRHMHAWLHNYQPNTKHYLSVY